MPFYSWSNTAPRTISDASTWILNGLGKSAIFTIDWTVSILRNFWSASYRDFPHLTWFIFSFFFFRKLGERCSYFSEFKNKGSVKILLRLKWNSLVSLFYGRSAFNIAATLFGQCRITLSPNTWILVFLSNYLPSLWFRSVSITWLWWLTRLTVSLTPLMVSFSA